MAHDEPEFEALLRHAYPGYESQVEGCSEAELAAIEGISPAPIPAFYRWFLTHFGGRPGPLRYPFFDVRASAIIDLYDDEDEGWRPQLHHGLIIGRSTDPMWADMHYDLRHPARDDARVVISSLGGETFREWLTWDIFLSELIPRFGQACNGLLVANDEGRVLDDISSVMRAQGFVEPIPTGTRTRFFMASKAALAIDGGFDTNSLVAFRAGVVDSLHARQLLGLLSTQTGVTLDRLEWSPAIEGG